MEFFFGIVLVATAIVLIVAFNKEDAKFMPLTIAGAILFAGISCINEYFSPSITPIDVYRGNTTLEITYRDSIAIDSVVVWKEEVK